MVGGIVQTTSPISELVMFEAAVGSRAEYLADLAVAALLDEALLTPKPALVDLRGSGAHRDLDLPRMLASARSLRGAFLAMAGAAAEAATLDVTLRETLGALGRDGERRMLAVTGGSNSHRGAIWVLGLLVAARAHLPADASSPTVAAAAACIARWPDRFAPPVASHGSQVCSRFGVPGARGEAQAGFPHVLDVGLPALRAARAAGAAEHSAQLDALLSIMCTLDDTCVLHRGGAEALAFAQAGARAVLARGGSGTSSGTRALLALDSGLLRRHASPGGCADLLAACLFLDRYRM